MSETALDPSIPLRAGQGIAQPPNPLMQYQQMLQVKQLANQNALFPGQQQIQGQTITGNDLANQNAALALQQAKNKAVYAGYGPLLNDPNLTMDKITTALASQQANGLDTSQAIADLHANADPANLGAYVRSKFASTQLSGPDQVSTFVGTPAEQNAGGTLLSGTRGGVLSPTAGGFQPSASTPLSPSPQMLNTGGQIVPTAGGVPTGGAPIPVTMSPGELTAPTQIGVTPQGAPIVGTRQQFINKTGGQPSPLGTGRLPPLLLNPANAANATPPSGGSAPATPAPPASALAGPDAPSQGIVTGIGPAQTASLSQQGASSAKAFQDISDQGVQARSQNAILGNMLGDAANFTSGQPGLNSVKATIAKYSPALAASLNVPASSVAANESFDKLANQIAGAQGAGSDARLAVAQGGNPSSHLSQAGIDQILRQLQGNADYLQARAKLAASYPDQTDRAGFETSVGAQLDPRAFQFARMTGPQKTAYAASLSSTDRAAVHSAYNFAAKRGLIGAADAN